MSFQHALTLFDSPTSHEFAGTDQGLHDLQLVVDEHMRTTLVSQPNKAEELKLRAADCKTVSEGRRYMTGAFGRVCRNVSPGLSPVVLHMAGVKRRNGEGPEMYSMEAACRVFNQVLDLRFEGSLSSSQMVIDEHSKTIVGLMGPKGIFLENSNFLAIACDMVAGVDAEFAGGSLAGRRMFLRFICPNNRIRTRLGDFFPGFAFVSTEAGDDAIRAYRLYQHAETGQTCLEVPRVKRQKQRRVGSKFAEQLKQVFTGILAAEPIEFGALVEDVASRRVFDSVEYVDVKRTMARWQKRLKLDSVPADIAQAVVASLLFYDQVVPAQRSDGELRSMTQYELYKSLTTAALVRPQRMREMLERAAFSVFFED
jgi:hypothetical protein